MSDSFVTAATNGPISGVDPTQIQWWNPSWRRGLAFRPNVDVLLQGVHLWHPGYPGIVNVNVSAVHVSINSGGATAIASAQAALGTVPLTAQWEDVVFSSPVELASNVEYMVWWERTCDANQDVARTEPYFGTVAGYDSLAGLLTAVEDTARFDPSTAGVMAPFGSHATVWYWIDPIVDAAPAAPPTVTGLLRTRAVDTERDTRADDGARRTMADDTERTTRETS